MSKPQGSDAEPRKFVKYHYRIEKDQWNDEMFFRELEFENPGLMDIPYYNAMRTSARERFDPAERLPRIDVASALRFRADKELIVAMKPPVHQDHSEVNILTLLTFSITPVVPRKPMSQQNRWKVTGTGGYRYIRRDGGRLDLEYIEVKPGIERGKPLALYGPTLVQNINKPRVLLSRPLITAEFDDPDGPYTVRMGGDSYQVIPENTLIPMKPGELSDESTIKKEPVGVRVGFRFLVYGQGNPFLGPLGETYERVAAAYESLVEESRSARIGAREINHAALVHDVPVIALYRYIAKRREERERQEEIRRQMLGLRIAVETDRRVRAAMENIQKTPEQEKPAKGRLHSRKRKKPTLEDIVASVTVADVDEPGDQAKDLNLDRRAWKALDSGDYQDVAQPGPETGKKRRLLSRFRRR